MLDHVLITLDFSPLAETAIPYGLKLVKPDGQITLLSVVEPQVAYATHLQHITPAPEVVDEQATAANNYLQQVTQKLSKPHPTIETLVLTGRAADTIIDTAGSMGVDAIVMSTHGRTGLGRWIFGSVTQKVLSATPCPVFVVPGVQESEQNYANLIDGNV